MHTSDKTKKNPHNFSRWILGITSATLLVLGPIIICLGYQANKFGVEILIADKALMGMGGIVSMLSIISIVGTVIRSSKVLLFTFYSSVILIIFISVFALGSWLMLNDIQDFIDRNWENLRTTAQGYSMAGFKSHAESEIQSLVAFSFTVTMLMIIAEATIWNLISKKIRESLLPVTSLILSILGSALIAVSFYSTQHSNYTQLPVWTSYIFILIGLTLMGLGVLGYYAATHSRQAMIYWFATTLGFVSVMILVAGIGSILLSSLVMKYLQASWPEINANLQEAGYDVEMEEFGEQLKLNFKFAGLFGLVNFCFLVLSFVGAMLYIRHLGKKQHTMKAIFN